MFNWHQRLHGLLGRSRNKGFTLVELLVVLTVNAFIFSALLFGFLASMNHSKEMISINRLNQQLETALFIMSNEIRRAGYSASASSDIGLDQNTNPFVASGVDISVNTDNNCILFAYDHDNNGSLPSISASIDDERYGFRLQDQAIQIRPPGASFSCSASASSWENMTDANLVQITALTFTLNTRQMTTGPGSRGIVSRSVDITITGNLKATPSITQTLTQHVRIRNDKFIP